MLVALLYHLADIDLGLPEGSPEKQVIEDIQDVLIALEEKRITNRQAETKLRCIKPAYVRRSEQHKRDLAEVRRRLLQERSLGDILDEDADEYEEYRASEREEEEGEE